MNFQITKIFHHRVVEQEWKENPDTFQWETDGWYFVDSEKPIYEGWEVCRVLEHDKHFRPIKAVVESIEIIKNLDRNEIAMSLAQGLAARKDFPTELIIPYSLNLADEFIKQAGAQ